MKKNEQLRYICCASQAKAVNDLAKVDGVAYSGAEISQPWSRLKMVVDLSGMELSQQTPLLYNHVNDPEFRLGEIKAVNDGKTLTVEGGIDKNTERGAMIVEAGRAYVWQLSIGAEVSGVKELADGETMDINGRTVSGPLAIVTKSRLREVSVVAVGADANTSLNIAASLNLASTGRVAELIEAAKKCENEKCEGDDADAIAQPEETVKDAPAENAEQSDKDEKKDNPEHENIEQEDGGSNHDAEAECGKKGAVNSECKDGEKEEGCEANENAKASAKIAEMQTRINELEEQLHEKASVEADRRDAIRAAAGDYADIAEKAISGGWSADQVKATVEQIEDKTKKQVRGTGMNIITKTGPAINANSISAALCFQTGVAESTITASYSAQDVEAGDQLRGITLKKVLELCCSMDDKPVPVMFGNDTITAAFSTASLPGILGNVANKKLLQSFTAQPIIATKLCKAGDLNDFKESERYRLTDVGDLEKVQKGGEIRHGGVREDKALNKLETYGKMFVLTRQDIYNDDLGAFLQVPAAMGQRAARKIDQLFHERLLSNPTFTDNYALFSTQHANYATGSDSALSDTSLKVARTKFLKAKDSDGQPINVAPKYLFVPSELDSTADALVHSLNMVGGSTAAPALNVISRYGLEVISSPYLSSDAYTGNSTTGWYLFGDPAQVDTFEIGYLQGRRVPVVEQGAVDFNTLGMGFRVVFDLGVREQGYQGMVFSKGVN